MKEFNCRLIETGAKKTTQREHQIEVTQKELHSMIEMHYI